MRFVVIAAIVMLAPSLAAADAPTPLTPWTASTPPTRVLLRLKDWRPPINGAAEVVVSLWSSTGEQFELGRFAPTEQGGAGSLAVRLPIPAPFRVLAAEATAVSVRLSPLHGYPRGGSVTLLSATLESASDVRVSPRDHPKTF